MLDKNKNQNPIKIILHADNKISKLKQLLANIGITNLENNLNIKIELPENTKLHLTDDLIDSIDINHNIELTLNKNSCLEYHLITTQNQKNSIQFYKKLIFNFVGEHSHAKIRIKTMCNKTQKFNFHTEQNHFSSHTSSCLKINAVLNDDAALICNNKIFVNQQLNNIFAKQINKNLLLGSQASLFTTPQLEVLSDNVKCKHGATVKTLDDDQLFYLNSRGLNFELAKTLLSEGFLR